MNRLTVKTVDSLTKPGRYADGGNLYLFVREGGSRSWLFKYRLGRKLREMSLGPYPVVSLKDAREKANKERANSAKGVDPIDERRKKEASKEADEQAAARIPTFGAFAMELVDSIESGFNNAKHIWQWRTSLKQFCGPIWETRIDRVDTAGVLACISPIWQTKAETASRVRGRIERVLNAATNTSGIEL